MLKMTDSATILVYYIHQNRNYLQNEFVENINELHQSNMYTLPQRWQFIGSEYNVYPVNDSGNLSIYVRAARYTGPMDNLEQSRIIIEDMFLQLKSNGIVNRFKVKI